MIAVRKVMCGCDTRDSTAVGYVGAGEFLVKYVPGFDKALSNESCYDLVFRLANPLGYHEILVTRGPIAAIHGRANLCCSSETVVKPSFFLPHPNIVCRTIDAKSAGRLI
jgi:hypothetical protein